MGARQRKFLYDLPSTAGQGMCSSRSGHAPNRKATLIGADRVSLAAEIGSAYEQKRAFPFQNHFFVCERLLLILPFWQDTVRLPSLVKALCRGAR